MKQLRSEAEYERHTVSRLRGALEKIKELRLLLHEARTKYGNYQDEGPGNEAGWQSDEQRAFWEKVRIEDEKEVPPVVFVTPRLTVKLGNPPCGLPGHFAECQCEGKG